MELTHLDLCTGIGGFHLAAEWAGFQTVGFSEVEPYCCQLLTEKWPEIPNYGDLRTADFSRLHGHVAVLSAGVPCQPASLAGKRGGSKDDRWLWPAVLDVTQAIRPAWAIYENPPGILALDEFDGVLLRLANLGYTVRLFSVPANAVGAKHLRQRVFIVAHAERCERTGSDGRREEIGCGSYAQPSGTSQDAQTLADAAEGRLRRAREGSRRSSIRSEEPALADADSAQRWSAQPGRDEHNGTETGRGESADRHSGVCDSALADADNQGLQGRDELRERAGEWVIGESGTSIQDFRLTQSPLCRRTDGIRDRSHRLKALGNSVVPAQVYPFFEAIAQTEMIYGN